MAQAIEVASYVAAAIFGLSAAMSAKATVTSRFQIHAMYHLSALVISLVACLLYLVLSLEIASQTSRYIDWVISTPIILVVLASLAHMPFVVRLMIFSLDVLVIVAGYASSIAPTQVGVWVVFAFAFTLFGGIASILSVYLIKARKFQAEDADLRAYGFLTPLTMLMWTAYPIIFVLDHSQTISKNDVILAYTVCDVLAKAGFSALLVGSREAIEGKSTILAKAVQCIYTMTYRDPTHSAKVAPVPATVARHDNMGSYIMGSFFAEHYDVTGPKRAAVDSKKVEASIFDGLKGNSAVNGGTEVVVIQEDQQPSIIIHPPFLSDSEIVHVPQPHSPPGDSVPDRIVVDDTRGDDIMTHFTLLSLAAQRKSSDKAANYVASSEENVENQIRGV